MTKQYLIESQIKYVKTMHKKIMIEKFLKAMDTVTYP